MLTVQLEALDQLLRSRAIPPGIERRLEIDQLADGERRVEMRLLRDIADAAEDLCMLIWHREPEDGDAPTERSQQAKNESNRGRLARAVGAEKSVDRPGWDVEIEFLDREILPGAIMQALEMDDVAHVVFAPSSVSRARCNSASETPERRASARSLRTSATACCERSRALRPGASSRTNVPAPWRISTNPCASRSRYACVMVAGLTRNSAASCRTDGSGAALPSVPVAIARRTRSAIWTY